MLKLHTVTICRANLSLERTRTSRSVVIDFVSRLRLVLAAHADRWA